MKQAYLHFEEPEIVFDLTSIGLTGEIVKTENELWLIFDGGMIDLKKVYNYTELPSLLETDKPFTITFYDEELEETISYNVSTNVKIFQDLLIKLIE